MAQYILPENQRLLWDTLHESKLFARVFPQLYDQSAWFQQIVQGIYDQRMGGNPIPLSQAALEKYNRDTMMYMMKDLQQRQAHTVSQHTMIPAAPLIANAIEDALGIRIKSMPLTAEKVALAIQAARTKNTR